MTKSSLAPKPIDRLLTELADQNASDLHLEPGMPPRIRKDGTLLNLPHERLDTEAIQSLIYEVSPDFDPDDYRPDEFNYEVSGVGKFRGVHLGVVHKEKPSRTLVMRKVPESPRSLRDIGAPKELRDFVKLEKGLVLITGGTGTGKTTTCHALLNEINRTREVVVATVEYIPEYTHVPYNSIFSRNTVQYDDLRDARTLKIIRNTQPDVIYIESCGDKEACREVMLAAQDCLVIMGHGGLSPEKTIRSFLYSKDEQEFKADKKLFAESLAGISTQELVINPSGEGRHAEFDVVLNTPSLKKKILSYEIGEYGNAADFER